MLRRLLCLCIIFSFAGSSLMPPQGQAAVLGLPEPGAMVSTSPRFDPPLIKGLKVHQDNPFLFDFIVDPGQGRLPKDALRTESERMVRYFFAALTIPDQDIWVNLSPYEKGRMIPSSLAVTAMGRDLLVQDYMLKQLTASLIDPQKALGKAFWDKVYAKAKDMYGTTEVPVNTFNKVWIVPHKAGIYERGQTAFIVNGHLKVMLEEDYLSTFKHRNPSGKGSGRLGSQIIRQIILPEIEKEINEGKNFATLRQIFYAQVLAVWFKRNLKQALLNRVYADKSTVKGIDQNDTATNEAIYRQYLRAYKKGVFNFIQEDIDPVTQESLPRKYFSGGYGNAAQMTLEPAELSSSDMDAIARDIDVSVVVIRPQPVQSAFESDAAMTMTDPVKRLTAGLLLFASLTTAMSGTVLTQKSLLPYSTSWMQNFLNDTVFKEGPGKGLPRIYNLPDDPEAQMDIWQSIKGKTELEGIIERIIMNRGLSSYDGSLWQISQALSGNMAAADALTSMIASGRFGSFDTIRAWDPKYFNYQGTRLSDKQTGLLFRIFPDSWKQKDPLTGADRFPGFPGSPDGSIVWPDYKPTTGENAWNIIGNLQTAFIKYNGDLTKIKNSLEFKLAKTTVDGFDLLMSPIGGIFYAPSGTYGDKPDQHISTENNLSAYAALRMMYKISGDNAYLERMKKIEGYFKNYAWDKAKGHFIQGGQYANGKFTPNPVPAVDVDTWGIAVLTPAVIDDWFGKGAAMRMWQYVKETSGYIKDGLFKGVGYTAGHSIISAEWTAGAIQAVLMLAEHYAKINQIWAREAAKDALAMQEGNESLATIYSKDGKMQYKGYAYANERYYIPFGWYANPIMSIASTAWPQFLALGFDPWVLGGKASWILSPTHIEYLEKQKHYDSGKIHSRYFDYRPARMLPEWKISFNWEGPAGQIYVRLKKQGESPDLKGNAKLIDIKPGKNNITLQATYPSDQLSFHFGEAWGQQLILGELSGVSVDNMKKVPPVVTANFPSVPALQPPKIPPASPSLGIEGQSVMASVNQLDIPDPGAAQSSSAFKKIVQMGPHAYPALKQIVLGNMVSTDRLKWAAYLAVKIAPSDAEARKFVDELKAGGFEWYVLEEAQNALTLRGGQKQSASGQAGSAKDEILASLDRLRIPDPGAARGSPAFKQIERMGSKAYPILEQIVLQREVQTDPLKWAAFLAAKLAPSDAQARRFVDQVKSGGYPSYVQTEAQNGYANRAMISSTGGIDLSRQDAALRVEKDANGGVKVNIDPALIARIEREGLPEAVPVIIDMKPADIHALFGISTP